MHLSKLHSNPPGGACNPRSITLLHSPSRRPLLLCQAGPNALSSAASCSLQFSGHQLEDHVARLGLSVEEFAGRQTLAPCFQNLQDCRETLAPSLPRAPSSSHHLRSHLQGVRHRAWQEHDCYEVALWIDDGKPECWHSMKADKGEQRHTRSSSKASKPF